MQQQGRAEPESWGGRRVADWLDQAEAAWLVRLIDREALIFACRTAADLALTPHQLQRTLATLRDRFEKWPERRRWSNARKLTYVAKGIRQGWGWKADAHLQQEREEAERSQVEAQRRNQDRHQEAAQRYAQYRAEWDALRAEPRPRTAAEIVAQRARANEIEARYRAARTSVPAAAIIERVLDAAVSPAESPRASRSAAGVALSDPSAPAAGVSETLRAGTSSARVEHAASPAAPGARQVAPGVLDTPQPQVLAQYANGLRLVS